MLATKQTSATPQDHRKLQAYDVALRYALWRYRLKVPKGNRDLVDQLARATNSVVLNIAEGAGEFSKDEKQRFYRMARRSAVECAAALDLLEVGGFKTPAELEQGRELLARVIAMLTKLVLKEPPRTSA